jgi:hypothetical protein
MGDNRQPEVPPRAEVHDAEATADDHDAVGTGEKPE